MNGQSLSTRLFVVVFISGITTTSIGLAQEPTDAQSQRRTLEAELITLQQSLKDRPMSEVVDAAIFAKGVAWALRYDRDLAPQDLTLLQTAVTRGRQRAESLAANTKGWTTRRGKLALGYVSRIDDSVQPYGLMVPQKYELQKAMRLDVVLHGSSQRCVRSDRRRLSSVAQR